MAFYRHPTFNDFREVFSYMGIDLDEKLSERCEVLEEWRKVARPLKLSEFGKVPEGMVRPEEAPEGVPRKIVKACWKVQELFGELADTAERMEADAVSREALAAAAYEEERVLATTARVEAGHDTAGTAALEAGIWDALEPRLRAKTKEAGVREFFAIQRGVLPKTLKGASDQFCDADAIEDVCVAAPTGSGKTLVFALTLLQFLVPRRTKLIRALVVAPSRELARQIFTEIQRFVPEPVQVDPGALPMPSVDVRCEHSKLDPQFHRDDERDKDPDIPDVLVSTPGRLAERLDDNSFEVDHLQYLVVDEADRLVAQEYSGWARKLLSKRAAVSREAGMRRLQEYWDAQDWLDWRQIGFRKSIPTLPTTRRLRKLLFSATLGDDPRHVAALRLVRPRFYFVECRGSGGAAAGLGLESSPDDDGGSSGGLVAVVKSTTSALEAARGKYVLSETLCAEDALLCDASTKPVSALYVLDAFFGEVRTHAVPAGHAGGGVKTAVVFCNAVDTCLRVAALLKLVYEEDYDRPGPAYSILELSSAASARRRDDAVRPASDRHTVIVASDAGSRGIDLPAVGLVLNYDLPSDAKTYVHRLGRTARAGRPGDAATLLKKGQQANFARMRNNIDRQVPTPAYIPRHKLKPLAPLYRAALGGLKAKLDDIKRGTSARAAAAAAATSADDPGPFHAATANVGSQPSHHDDGGGGGPPNAVPMDLGE